MTRRYVFVTLVVSVLLALAYVIGLYLATVVSAPLTVTP